MRFLVKKAPDGFIKSVNDEISSILNRSFDSFFPEYILNNEEGGKYAIALEIHEKDNEYNIRAELPGIKKEDLDIDIDKNHITINAKRTEETKQDTKGFRKSEFKYGEFSRTIYFPEEVDVDKTNAKLQDGILNIDVPKLVIEKHDKKKLTVQ